MKYSVLVNVIDKIRSEAPVAYKSYSPSIDEIEKLNNARARAFIHLFLKVKFGIIDFEKREYYITDGTNDGGIDGYFIDSEKKEIFLIQSKFRTTKENFEDKEITYDELLSMDVSRITSGETKQENTIDYNGKIQRLIREIADISDIPRWKYYIVLLANIKENKKDKIKRITNDFDCEIYNYERCYNELIYPIVSGSFYNISELNILLNVSNKNESVIDYDVETEFEPCNITVCFVPTIEISKIIYKYKNSILKFNPRSYLELSNNTVNPAIRKTIIDKRSNEFALFNNGITMLSDETDFSTKAGRKGSATLSLKNPQIINGGQTAFTLGRIYEEFINTGQDLNVFDEKEVMLKVITFNNQTVVDEIKKLNLIESISKATNQQTYVTDADRRSNDAVLIKAQNYIYERFGLFFERKRGEFGDGLKYKYIERILIIDREVLLRIAFACDNKISETKTGDKRIYTETNLKKYFEVEEDELNKYIFVYKGYLSLNSYDSNNVSEFGHSLKYGKYAVAYILSSRFNKNWHISEYDSKLKEEIALILSKWNLYESTIIQLKANSKYFKEINNSQKVLNFINYYKGTTVNSDLKNEFSKIINGV